MKKLLFVTYSLANLGGVEMVLVNLINELADEYEITVLCLDGKYNFIYDLKPNINKVILDSYGNTKSYKVMILMDKYLLKIPKQPNIKSYIYQYGVYCLLKKWLKKNSEDYNYIISCRYTISSMLSTMKKINKKTIAWEHVNYKIGGLLWNKIMRPYYKNLKSIVYLNNESSRYYKNINSNSIQIPNIMSRLYEGTPFISLEEKENSILFVGRLHPEKNIKELVDIFYKIKNTEKWTFYILGDGVDKQYIENFIKEKNINNISLEGNKNSKEVKEYMKKSKILLLASETECLPTVLVEAMFCSNILISYNTEFGPANIINDNNGFLIEFHNKENFIEKLQLLIDDEELLKKLNKSSYEESIKWKKEKSLELWRKLLN